MMKNATRKPRMIIVSGSARKISRRPPISGRSAIAPAAAAPAPAITAPASSANTDTLTTFRNLSTSCFLEWLVLTSGFVVILHFRQELDPVQTGGLDDVPDDGEAEEHGLADPGNQDSQDVPHK